MNNFFNSPFNQFIEKIGGAALSFGAVILAFIESLFGRKHN